MSSRQVSELEFATSREPLATIEVDIDSIPPDYFGYADIVAQSLESFAASDTKPRATVYVLQTDSVNFHEPTYSAFFAIAGQSGGALERLYAAFKSVQGVKVRYSDHVTPRQGTVQFHVQDGVVWQPEDAVTWYASSADGEVEQQEELIPTGEAVDVVTAPSPNDEPVGDSPSVTISAGTGPVQSGVRFRRARSDASVGTIRRSIETIFGLPAGSVKLCDPDGRALRSDAAIRTLRKRWEAAER